MNKFDYNLGVVGLGYVGLPLAVESANSKLSVLGFDTSSNRVEEINNGHSPIEDISDDELENALNSFFSTDDPTLLSKCHHIVISVPTPLTDYQPDLSYVEGCGDTNDNMMTFR